MPNSGALDLVRIGMLCLRGGRWAERQVLSRRWIEELWTPCRVKPEYGLSWWLNDEGTVWPGAPCTGRCARGNGGSHLLWVDRARDLVIASCWGAEVERLLAEVSSAVPPRVTRRGRFPLVLRQVLDNHPPRLA
ncbi:hypothetical protein [Streptomyces sp. NPDC055013]